MNGDSIIFVRSDVVGRVSLAFYTELTSLKRMISEFELIQNSTRKSTKLVRRIKI